MAGNTGGGVCVSRLPSLLFIFIVCSLSRVVDEVDAVVELDAARRVAKLMTGVVQVQRRQLVTIRHAGRHVRWPRAPTACHPSHTPARAEPHGLT